MLMNTNIIQGVFSLSYLAIFCKCSSLCPAVEINLRNDWPIIFKYTVAALGELKLCLSPMCDGA
jgi:proliferating cell nuclear antigen